MKLEERIQYYLQQRIDKNLYRQLMHNENLIDFSSNDYLGLAQSAFLRQQIDLEYKSHPYLKIGATGSRLLNGNSILAEELEALLATIHQSEAALLFNSGFDANVGLISTVAKPGDIIFYDELVHASIHQGMKLSGAQFVSFKHNDIDNLKSLILKNSGVNVKYLITESVFSMEGDRAKLKEIASISREFDLNLIIDEAHAVGLYGRHGAGLCNELQIEKECFARVITFGKAIGSHGAAVIGSQILKDYLINFSKNFIYTTALETHNLLTVKHSYLYIQNNINQVFNLRKLINYFIIKVEEMNLPYKIVGQGPIFGIKISNNSMCKNVATYLQTNGIDVRAILSPTVAKESERLRVILHSYNTTEQIDFLFLLINDYQRNN